MFYQVKMIGSKMTSILINLGVFPNETLWIKADKSQVAIMVKVPTGGYFRCEAHQNKFVSKELTSASLIHALHVAIFGPFLGWLTPQ